MRKKCGNKINNKIPLMTRYGRGKIQSKYNKKLGKKNKKQDTYNIYKTKLNSHIFYNKQ